MMNTPIQPAMSVILVTPDTYQTIRQVISFLQAQTVKERLELILVGPSKAVMQVPEQEFVVFQHYQILEVGKLTASAAARVAGIRAASAVVVVFLEDHTFPTHDWAECIIQAHEQNWAGVGPVMLNANPNSMTSWANILLAFGQWIDRQDGGLCDRLPPHNTAYKRDLLLSYDDKLDTWLDAESIMQDDLRQKGYQFYFQPKAKLHHLNISKIRSFIIEQYTGGRLFGAARCTSWSWLQRGIYIVGSPLIPLRRLPELLVMIKPARRWKQLMPHVLPPLLLGLVVHSFGEMMGYAFRAGRAKEISTQLEFHHDHHLSIRDQNWGIQNGSKQ